MEVDTMQDHLEKARMEQLQHAVKFQARYYLESFPGNDTHAGNTDHQHMRDLLKGKHDNRIMWTHLRGILEYWISAMNLATRYKDLLHLQFPPCHIFPAEMWMWELCSDINQEGGAGKLAASKLARYEGIRELAASAFRPARRGQGNTYKKPIDYLAMALCDSGLSLEQTRRALDNLKFEITLMM